MPLLLKWFYTHARDLPWRRTRDPYAIWISEIMLQQTQVKTVLPFWQRWMQTFPNVHALAAADPERVLKLWEGLGYYTRARNLHAAAKIIVQKSGGEFPRDFAEVIALPGIGRYTAGAICSIAFNQPAPILDGNVIRVLTRVFGIRAPVRARRTTDRLWQLAEDLVQLAARANTSKHQRCSRLNQSLMELGALVCLPREPKCDVCPLAPHCVARQQGRIENLPNLAKRAPATARTFVAFVAQVDDYYLVRQRPAAGVNARLWEFPNQEVEAPFDAARIAARLFSMASARLEHLCQVRHTITRYRITVEFFRALFAIRPAILNEGPARWCRRAELVKLAFPSAHRRIADLL
ncbi:MAG: A/G-specific adenine glycosylase [Verrucomicrobia bacterium]|nr:A/G-specific adenine glycosylase [Verrucomicrobiota bacterium]